MTTLNESKWIHDAFSTAGVTPANGTLDASYAWLLENLVGLHTYSYGDVTAMMRNMAELAYEQYEQAYDDAREQWAMMRNMAELAYEQYEQAYDDAREQWIMQCEEDEQAWLGSTRPPETFKPRPFPAKLSFKAWRAASDYSAAKRYVWGEVKEARHALGPNETQERKKGKQSNHT